MFTSFAFCMIPRAHGPRPWHVILLLFACCWCTSLAAAEDRAENQIKAAIIYNLTRFVEWPPTPAAETDTLRIGVVGNAANWTVLQDLNGKRAGSRPVRIVPASTPEQLTTCDVVYFSEAIDGQIERYLAPLRMLPILTIGDAEGFSRRGGIVELAKKKNKIRFLIRLDLADDSGLRLSSQLLKVAELVTGES